MKKLKDIKPSGITETDAIELALKEIRDTERSLEYILSSKNSDIKLQISFSFNLR